MALALMMFMIHHSVHSGQSFVQKDLQRDPEGLHALNMNSMLSYVIYMLLCIKRLSQGSCSGYLCPLTSIPNIPLPRPHFLPEMGDILVLHQREKKQAEGAWLM